MDFNKFCNICFKKEDLIKLRAGENEPILNILILLTLRPDVFNDHMIYLCTHCCSNLENIDKFREMCLINLINFRDLYNQYKQKLEMSNVPDTVMKLKTFIEMNVDRPSGAALLDYEVTETFPSNTNANGNISNKNSESSVETIEVTYIPESQENENISVKDSLNEGLTKSDGKNKRKKPSTNSKKNIVTTSDPSCSKSGNDDNCHIFIKQEYNFPDRDPLEVDSEVESDSDNEELNESSENESGTTSNISSSASSNVGNFQIFIKDEHKLLNRDKLQNVTNPDDEEQHECNVCHEVFSQASQLKLHLRDHARNRSRKYETMVRKMGGHSTRAKVHVDGEGPYKCPVCEKNVSKIVSFKAHLRYHLRENSYKCEICQKTFSTSGDLTIHERTHSGERPYKCSGCEKSFSSSGCLKKHERVHTGEKPYKCSMCEKAFTQLSILNTHERIHTGSRPYQCSMCDMKFTSSSNMKRHELVHTGEKAFKCSVCKKPFARTSDLKVHERIHNKDKNYSCHLCKKTFTDISSLQSHERVHSGALIFNCSECEKTFTTAHNLRRHQLLHTKDKPHKCNVCDHTFSQLSSLKKHELTHTVKLE